MVEGDWLERNANIKAHITALVSVELQKNYTTKISSTARSY